MKKLVNIGLCLALWSHGGLAFDVQSYKKTAEETIREIRNGNTDVKQLIVLQEKLIRTGIAGIQFHTVRHNEHARLLDSVAANADSMKALTLEKIENDWHAGGYFEKSGIPFEHLDHFGIERSLMDAVIHPATAYICLRNYEQNADNAMLERVVAELSEVLEHIKFIK